YSTAGGERCARIAAPTFASPVRYSPLDTAKTTPLTIIGVSGDVRSRDVQPGCSASAPPSSATLNAAIAPFVTIPLAAGFAPALIAPAIGARIQRVPCASCQLASAPPATSPPPLGETASG